MPAIAMAAEADLRAEIAALRSGIREMEERAFGNIVYECRCQCGNITHVRGSLLRSGNTKSCGCLREEICANFNKKE